MLVSSIAKRLRLIERRLEWLEKLQRVASTKRSVSSVSIGRGSAETSVVLVKIQTLLLLRGFFRKTRSTAETRAELRRRTGIQFQSRKISQALGMLHRKRVLARFGKKGSFRYLGTR